MTTGAVDSTEWRGLPATVFRGGTSKGVYLHRDALPADEARWDDLLLRLFGSPDPKQIDGIGGSHSTASKVMIVWPSEDPAVDVDYRFGQVGIEQPVVDWGGNCGNLTFGVGPYALEHGMTTAEANGGRTQVVLRNENTETVVEQSIPVSDTGRPTYKGEFRVAGVPRPGARIRSRFMDPGGAVTGATFPTGNRTEILDADPVGPVEVSIVDVANPCVVARAEAVGLSATERPDEINEDPDTLKQLEAIRSAACERLEFVDTAADATAQSPGLPKMVVVGPAQAYETVGGETIDAGDYDLLARTMSMQTAHHAYAVTGAMCTAAAALLRGTVSNEFLSDVATDPFRIGHPKGLIRVGVELEGEDVVATSVDRTARMVMDGRLFDPEGYSAAPPVGAFSADGSSR